MHYFGSCPEIRSSSRFLREIWISYFARRILEGIFVGGIVIIRNECLFFSVHAICLFRTAIHFPWTEKKRHSFLKSLPSVGTSSRFNFTFRYCSYTPQTLKIIWTRCILLNLRWKTRQQTSFLPLTYICSVDQEGRPSSRLYLRQTWWF